jgi:hypothetical protein
MELDKNYAPQDGTKSNPGPFLARVVNNNDPTYMGILEVEILRPAGSDNSPAVFQQVKYLNPFYGVTALANNGKDPNNYDNTQKSYGMWMVPPDVGQTVVVIYINGNPKYAYWIGCVMDDEMNFMLPGQAATQQVVEGEGRLPVGEYNKLLNERIGDPEQVKKPASPLADVLTAQGLIKDDIRGITTSSARRESPSNVYGISTPGPLDKRSGAKKSLVGKPGSQVNTWVSRLGGHTFVMDDGDANFVRKGPASDSPPEYAAVEQGEDGDPTIPHNELIRIRTRTGHQILLHNSEDLIYIANARGTAWIELTSNGKIDIYAADSISMHTGKDFNVTADGDINLTSTGGSINLNASESFFATAGANYEIKAGADGKLTVGGQSNIHAGGQHVETASAIHMNGPGADSAADAPIAPRVPDVEPWDGHENLHDTELTYTTTTDTFMKEKS